MDAPIFLHGVALANYRGIGPEPQLIGPFKRFNFMIGPNNAGKSCVLSFIANYAKPLVADYQPRYSSGQKIRLSALDVRLGCSESQVRMAIGVPTESILERAINANSRIKELRHVHALLTEVLSKVSTNGLLWVEQKRQERGELTNLLEIDLETLKDIGDANTWQRLWNLISNRSGGDLLTHWIQDTLHRIYQTANLSLPEASLVPAIREISESGHDFKDWTGSGLIEELARLQNPGVQERKLIEKFKRINSFLQAVTGNPSASIEIPHDRQHVLVHMDEKVLPLSSLGTGIHEVVMLAAFCTLMEKQIVCIEEPEIHLHPVLQRRLVQFLEENTDNQYFIATHSASLIDAADAAVFQISNETGFTTVKLVISSSSRFDVCRDLGYLASDILQSNMIIWVEGPSDRLYLKHWIRAVDPDLKEGIDYSIMFYGGRLLSHLSADDDASSSDDISALIAVRRLNRNLAIIIDSDKSEESAAINLTKSRINDELKLHGGFSWITSGREIENYVSKELMTEALRSVYPSFDQRYKTGKFDHVLPFRNSEGKIVKEVDKVRIARGVCKQPADLDVLDLREMIEGIVLQIRSASRP